MSRKKVDIDRIIFKSRGFNLEDINMVDSERLSRLFTLLTLALYFELNQRYLLTRYLFPSVRDSG